MPLRSNQYSSFRNNRRFVPFLYRLQLTGVLLEALKETADLFENSTNSDSELFVGNPEVGPVPSSVKVKKSSLAYG